MPDWLSNLQTRLSSRYRIERELGRGGMAVVLLAEDLRHARHVAIKVLIPEVAAVIGTERFLREMRVAASLQHPHILPLLDSGEAGNVLYAVLPHVEGESLRARLDREKQIAVEDALRMTGELARALDYAHAHGVVHRDVKPGNVLLSDGHALLADFGIARAAEDAGATRLTESGVSLGTPAYMSPEQAVGSREVDGRSDQYALACLCFEMLAGQPPFTGATEQSVVHQHLTAEPPRVTTWRTSAPAPAERALIRALSKAPADRFATCVELARAMAPDAVVSTPLPEPVAPRPAAANHRRGLVGIAFAIVALAVVVFFAHDELAAYIPGWMQPPRPPKQWVLVADFEAEPRDPSLEGAAHDLVVAALSESKRVAPVPAGQVALALESAGRPDSTRLTPELARELAVRRSVRGVVEGRLRRVGTETLVTLSVLDVESNRTVVTLTDRATGPDRLIEAMERLGRKLRSRLGERVADIRATRPLTDIRTPSFEAFQELRASGQSFLAGDPAGQVQHVRRALELDPAFAYAWDELSSIEHNRGRFDSAIVFVREALRHSDRLSSSDRLRAKVDLATLLGKYSEALSSLHQLLAEDSTNSDDLGHLAFVESQAGRMDRALDASARAIRLAPFGPNQAMLWNHAAYLSVNGRIDEALETARRLVPALRAQMEIEALATGGRYAAAESLSARVQGDPSVPARIRASVRFASGWCLAARGDLAGAEKIFRESGEGSLGQDRVWRYAIPRMELGMAEYAGLPIPVEAMPPPGDSTSDGLMTRALFASVIGRPAEAERLTRAFEIRLRRMGIDPDDSPAPNFLEARIALARGHPQEAVARLGDRYRIFRAGPGGPSCAPTTGEMAIALVEAYEAQGMRDSAAACLTYMLDGPLANDTKLSRSVGASSLRQRLVMLDLEMGHVQDARRDFDRLVAVCDRPDATMRAQIESARQALASAEAVQSTDR